MPGMNPDYRKRLLGILADLDQMATDAADVQPRERDADTRAMENDLRRLISKLRAKVEGKLERGAKGTIE
jgi:hypothetical protein